MITLDELEKLADAALLAQYRTLKVSAVSPTTIKKLIALARLQHEALTRVGRDQYPVIEEAIAAFDNFGSKE